MNSVIGSMHEGTIYRPCKHNIIINMNSEHVNSVSEVVIITSC